MNPLMSKQVQRGQRLDEWVSSEHQATLDGLNEFKQRQEERKLRVQAEAKSKVRVLKPGSR